MFSKVFLSTLFRFRVEGREHIIPQQPLILAGNHAGLLDGLMVLAAYPGRFRFLMKEEVLAWPGIGRVLKRINPIVVREGHEIGAIREAVRELKKNNAICIFPEGKLSRDGAMAEFKSGVGLLQKLSGAPILPFTLCGSFEAWPWGRKRPHLFKPLNVRFYPVLNADKNTPDVITEKLQELLAANLKRPASHPACRP